MGDIYFEEDPPEAVEDDGEPLLSLEIDLDNVIINKEDTFRTQNASINDWERRNVIERTRGNIHTHIDLMEVSHGTSMDGNEATLMVFRFRFDPQKNSRRVTRARANIEFFPANKNGSAPVVDTIAPDGRWTVKPTTDQESTTRGGELNVGSTDVAPVTVGAAAKLEKTVSRDISDATTVTGSINLGTGKNSGESTVAAWNLLENKRRETGVPDELKVAVLLRREDNKPFNAIVTLEVDADFKSGLEQKFVKAPLDDPVLFNPTMTGSKPKKGRRYGVENLRDDGLYSLCEVRMAVEASFAA